MSFQILLRRKRSKDLELQSFDQGSMRETCIIVYKSDMNCLHFTLSRSIIFLKSCSNDLHIVSYLKLSDYLRKLISTKHALSLASCGFICLFFKQFLSYNITSILVISRFSSPFLFQAPRLVYNLSQLFCYFVIVSK